MLHVYEIQPDPKKKTKTSDLKDTGESKEESHDIPAIKYSYLALLQRKLEYVNGPFLHPFQPRVFGSPLLLRVCDLEGFTGNDLYAHVSQQVQRYIPYAFTHNDTGTTTYSCRGVVDATNDTAPSHARRGRQNCKKTTVDMESVAAGDIPPYGFRLRLVSREGSRCALCSWFSCCIGCLVPCDDFPVVAECGDSISIDWHMSVDLSGGGFGWDITKSKSKAVNVNLSPHAKALIRVKKHSSFNGIGKKFGYTGSITLEECLDSFAKEEKIPEVSLWL